MIPVTNVDRLVLLLRQKLQERARSPQTERRSTRPTENARPRSTAQTVQALSAIEGVDDRQLQRALIQGVLTDQFGDRLVNEPRFQQVVDQILKALEQDEDGAALIDRITRELRAST